MEGLNVARALTEGARGVNAALATRKVIGQAIGILMERYALSCWRRTTGAGPEADARHSLCVCALVR